MRPGEQMRLDRGDKDAQEDPGQRSKGSEDQRLADHQPAYLPAPGSDQPEEREVSASLGNREGERRSDDEHGDEGRDPGHHRGEADGTVVAVAKQELLVMG